MRLDTMQDGTWGFDCNSVLSPEMASAFFQHGYEFVGRYVPRASPNPQDLTREEFIDIQTAGLAVHIVQHVKLPPWMPTAELGELYGKNAADRARAIGYIEGACLSCDLEGVSSEAETADVLEFLKRWYHTSIDAGGYAPMLYVGDSCGLTSEQLYHETPFARYWGAYNLNRENYPAVRGLQMKQKSWPTIDRRVLNCPFGYQEDYILTDKLGSSPLLALP